MLSKEEIEFNLKALSGVMLNFEDRLCDEMQERIKEVKEYIEQLEHDKDIMQRALKIQTVGWNEGAKLFAEKQKLIEKLEEDNNIDTERVRHYEKAYRNAKKCGDTFYMKSHKRKIDTANARREVRKSILEILKKE